LNNSALTIKIGAFSTALKTKVSQIDWCADAIKNFLFFGIFSNPLNIIFVLIINLTQKII